MNLCYTSIKENHDEKAQQPELKKSRNMGYEGNWTPDQLHVSTLFCTPNMLFIAHCATKVLSLISEEKCSFIHIYPHTLIYAVHTSITNIKSVK